ncbi:MAG: hypothetical protein F6K19_36740 [Cyanothece sp. SIO1E1]|nr:hypothetical protein [Cyanothece sp. SIO1E1]
MLIGLYASWRAGAADFSVLYGNHFNIHQQANPAWWYAASIAIFIQLLILVPAGVVAKILVNGLQQKPKSTNATDTSRKHLIQLGYLTPILLTGFLWSGKLSLNMDQAVRSESKGEYAALWLNYETVQQRKDSIDAQLRNDRNQEFQKDSLLAANELQTQRMAIASQWDRKIDSLKNRRTYLLELYKSPRSAPWMQGEANNIKRNKLPNARQGKEAALSQLAAQHTSTLLAQRTETTTLYKANQLGQDTTHNQITGEIQKQLDLLNADIRMNSQKRMMLSIIFNCISLIIVFGLHEVYKRINQEKKALSPPPHSYAASTLQPVNYTEPPNLRTLVTQEPDKAEWYFEQLEKQRALLAPTKTETVLVKQDINRLQLDIRTYYKRCFPKSKTWPLGSAKSTTCLKNKARVEAMIERLSSYGVTTQLSFERPIEVQFFEEVN